jgi:hypothetical protein
METRNGCVFHEMEGEGDSHSDQGNLGWGFGSLVFEPIATKQSIKAHFGGHNPWCSIVPAASLKIAQVEMDPGLRSSSYWWKMSPASSCGSWSTGVLWKILIHTWTMQNPDSSQSQSKMTIWTTISSNITQYALVPCYSLKQSLILICISHSLTM